MGRKEQSAVHRPEYDILRDLLRVAREESGLSRRQLSKLVGRETTYVSKIERGERRLDVTEFIALTVHLKAGPEALFHELRTKLEQR